MRWLFLAHKATQCFLSSQRYHLHDGGSRRLVFHASNMIGWSQPYQMTSSSSYYGHSYSTSTILGDADSSNRFSDCNKIGNDVTKVDLEIISREIIKPSSPTPRHLRTFNLSILDQTMLDVYNPLIVFLPNTDKASVTDVVTQRSKHLKETLSRILTRFYPLAGKLKDNLKIDCDDEGVYFTEAQVNQTLQDFLFNPDDDRIGGLMPEKPCPRESSMRNYVMGIQVNIFICGGIGLSMSVSHKIVDGHSYYMFMEAWAAAARGSEETVSPSFVASEIFPNNPCLEYPTSDKLLTTKMLCTKRFVFDSSALALLKAQLVANISSARPPTRMEATTAVIWKAAAQASSKVRPFGPQSPHIISLAVNIRKRTSPALPEESFGNLIEAANAICFPGGHLDLPSLMVDLRESIAKINSDYIESRKGEKGHETFKELSRRLKQLDDVIAEGDCMVATSLLNRGMYELDFGWGKPIWFYAMNAGIARRVTLNDTLKGGGVEAIVTLSPDEMEIFERDSEILSYAIVNPSPLQFVH